MNNTSIEIKNLWRIIAISETSILELRAIWPPDYLTRRPAITKHFHASNYSSVEECKLAFETEAIRLNTLGYNIYVVMNPIKQSFSGVAATDMDILCRVLLLIDIDRVEKRKEPATDAEIEAASQLAEDVIAYLEHLEWPDPIRVMSGNGHHLYYLLPKFENNDESKEFAQSLLINLADKFDNAVVKIDTSVFNASRITKVVGTIARKGNESEGRPYRMARML